MKSVNMKFLFFLFLTSLIYLNSFAQQQKREPRKELKQGNEAYRQKNFQEAERAYLQALEKKPESFIGNYNLGDALYQKENFEQARGAFQNSLELAENKAQKAQALHNIGNTFMKEKKWEEAINAYKKALKQNPQSGDSKYNLAYAQQMLKKDQNQKDQKPQDQDKKDQDKKDQDKKDQEKKDQEKKDQDKKDQEKKDQDKKDQEKKDQDQKDQEEPQHPQPQPSKLTKQEAENLLNALQQEEKKLHNEQGKEKGVPVQQDKDW